MIPLVREARSLVARSRKRAALRALLSDRKWHTTGEILAVAGSGMSSRLHELRSGADGLPALVIDAEPGRGGEGWSYRVSGEVIPGANLDGGAAEAFEADCRAADAAAPLYSRGAP